MKWFESTYENDIDTGCVYDVLLRFCNKSCSFDARVCLVGSNLIVLYCIILHYIFLLKI